MKSFLKIFTIIVLFIISNISTYLLTTEKVTTKFQRDLITKEFGHYNQLLDFEYFTLEEVVLNFILKKKIEQSLRENPAESPEKEEKDPKNLDL